MKTETGITTNLKRNSKSYEKNNEQRVTRIEVDSDKYNDELIYQDVTLDTEMEQYRNEQLNSLFAPLPPEDKFDGLTDWFDFMSDQFNKIEESHETSKINKLLIDNDIDLID